MRSLFVSRKGHIFNIPSIRVIFINTHQAVRWTVREGDEEDLSKKRENKKQGKGKDKDEDKHKDKERQRKTRQDKTKTKRQTTNTKGRSENIY